MVLGFVSANKFFFFFIHALLISVKGCLWPKFSQYLLSLECQIAPSDCFNSVLHSKITILSSFTQPHFVLSLYDFFFLFFFLWNSKDYLKSIRYQTVLVNASFHVPFSCSCYCVISQTLRGLCILACLIYVSYLPWQRMLIL